MEMKSLDGLQIALSKTHRRKRTDPLIVEFKQRISCRIELRSGRHPWATRTNHARRTLKHVGSGHAMPVVVNLDHY